MNSRQKKWVIFTITIILIGIAFRYDTIFENKETGKKINIKIDRWRSRCVFCEDSREMRKYYYYKVACDDRVLMKFKAYKQAEEFPSGGISVSGYVVYDTLFMRVYFNAGYYLNYTHCIFKIPLSEDRAFSEIPIISYYKSGKNFYQPVDKRHGGFWYERILSKNEVDSLILGLTNKDRPPFIREY
jgi:hypothetical protein